MNFGSLIIMAGENKSRKIENYYMDYFLHIIESVIFF